MRRPRKCKGDDLYVSKYWVTWPDIWIYLITCKRSNSPLDVVAVVALDAEQMLAKDEWRPGDEDDAGEGENSEDAVQDCASLF